jgi:PAS domain S-box-containing protein
MNRVLAPESHYFNSEEDPLWALIDLCADYYWEEDQQYNCLHVRHCNGVDTEPNLLQNLPGNALWDIGFIVVGAQQSWPGNLTLRSEHKDFRELICQLPTFHCPDERAHYLSISGKARFDNNKRFIGYHCIARDISAQISNEQSLRRFRAAMDMSGDMVYLIDRNTMKFIDVNETARRRMGLSRAEVLQRGPYLHVLKETRQEIEARYDKLIQEGTTSRLESVSINPDGRRFDLETYSRATCIDGRWIIIGITRNITPRKEAERKANKLQRMYSALSDSNASILRAKDINCLYTGVCTAAVSGGEFSCAAIFAPNSEGFLTPCTASGHFSPFFLQLKVPPDPTHDEAQGLVGLTYHTGRFAVSNDLINDKRFAPWHERIKAGKARSAAGFPLVCKNKTVAILLLYSFESNSFDDEILAFLQNVSDNISFALENFENEIQRKEAQRILIQSEARFKSLTQLIADFYWEMDTSLKFICYEGKVQGKSNQEAVAELLDNHLWNHTRVKPKSMSWDAFKHILERRQRFRDFELSFTNSDRVIYHFSMSGEPIYDASSLFCGYRGIARDVTASQASLAPSRL